MPKPDRYYLSMSKFLLFYISKRGSNVFLQYRIPHKYVIQLQLGEISLQIT